MPAHSLMNFASGLSAKLAAKSRHVSMFLGAGVGASCGLPDVAALQDKVLESLDGDAKESMASQLEGRIIEEALSRLRRIAALVQDDQTVDGLTGPEAAGLDTAVCQSIVAALAFDDANLQPVEHFAAWAGRASYDLPLEVFTVNYDLLLETALEGRGVPYFDGFVGNLEGSFQTQLVESAAGGRDWVPSFFVRLWKLHGSVNWVRQDDGHVVRMGRPVPEGLAAAIYPSDMKYDESRRVPFVVLADRLRRSLYQPESLTLVAGYSFGDSHLNEVIFDAAGRCERSETVVFCYGDIPVHLAQQAVVAPNLQVVSPSEAILGGVRANWKKPEDPPPDLWNDDGCALGDFRHLAAYLARSTARESEADPLLALLLCQAPEVPHEAGGANDNG